MKNYTHLFFDCDGVILNSNQIKTDAFYKLAFNFGELQAQKLVNYHIENGGISRYEKIKFFQKKILKNTNIKLYQELVDNYGTIVKEKLMKAEISKGVFKIKQFFPNSKITVVSGSDQNELRWLFKEKRIDHFFNNGIFGSPKNKIEILDEIFSGFKGEEKSIFIGDSKYDFEVSKFFKIDFAFISDWSELSNWTEFARINKIKTFKDILSFLENHN